MRTNLRALLATHAGLGLYKGLSGFDPADKQKLLEAIAKTPIGSAYQTAFDRWREVLKGAVFIEATTTTPLAIGLGNSSPIENGLAIHHTYGTPYLPGSAIKGLLRRAAGKYGLNEEQQAVMFGEEPNKERRTQGSAGHLVYWDGWLSPDCKIPFQKDVITVHHPNYYSTGDKDWPTDFDDPNPVAFLSVKPGTKFVLAISSASENAAPWLYRAGEMLEFALTHLGLGGKTNAGYGYFEVKLPPKPKSETEQGQELLASYRKRIEGIKPGNERGELNFFLRELGDKLPAVRKPVLEAIKKQLVDWKSWKPTNPQHAEIDRLLEG
ncbi:type III-B CRISPR module RAMP protein Cmr6 [uncultured Meiothermus sp.]|jgi:CRISPR-associated protein Cmr6|uniref:type III-B CRISPR module RAMP protein Cmr6 n=1 Tax=uncultured Meiothermus sp. TaxID=157471 RepID=UPI00261EFA91|nr:type III-B CRISPR module RAMP protein Cmr6 [uncultured Meiothermus sp.]